MIFVILHVIIAVGLYQMNAQVVMKVTFYLHIAVYGVVWVVKHVLEILQVRNDFVTCLNSIDS